MGSWGERYVDEQVDRAWLDLRMALADRLAEGLAERVMEPIDFFTESDECLSVEVDDDRVLIVARGKVKVSDNVDEAAYLVYKILHEEWQVLHPVFLDSDVVDVASVEGNPVGTVVPTLGVAGSRETLQAWVEATFREACDEPLKVRTNGDISWRGRRGTGATVSVRDEHWIEVWSVLATQVGFKKARKVVERLSRRYPGVSFSFRRDLLVMSRLVDAGPYVPEHLTDALSMHLELAEKLAWVREAVLRKRVEQQREQTVPAALIALLPSADRVPSSVLVERVRAAAGSQTTLADWKTVCLKEWRKARRLPRGVDDPDLVNHRLRTGWLRLCRAIDAARETDGGQVGDVA